MSAAESVGLAIAFINTTVYTRSMKIITIPIMLGLGAMTCAANDQFKKPIILKDDKGQNLKTGGRGYPLLALVDIDNDKKKELIIGYWDKARYEGKEHKDSDQGRLQIWEAADDKGMRYKFSGLMKTDKGEVLNVPVG